jgi:3-oxoacyl-[acyl-carrier protein] reductase
MPVTISLDGKAALVTGASQGIGVEIARRLAEAGALTGLAARNDAKAEEIAASIREAGGQAFALKMDVSDPASVAAGMKVFVERAGKLDILVNNAGITADGLILRMSKESWDKVMGTDLTGVFLVAQEAVKLMIKKKIAGRIINVSSVVGLMGNAGQTNYSAAKAGVVGFSMALAREIGSRGITVNTIAPGYIETAMTGELSVEQREKLTSQIVLGRLGTAGDVAGVALFLASDAASYITGTCINVSGGLFIG